MSRNGDVTFIFGDGPHKFRFAIGELQEFEEKFDIGAELVLRRLVENNDWRIVQAREAHRIGLIGGGMKPSEAYKLIERYASEPPFIHLRHGLQAILQGALLGAPDGEQPGKKAKAARAEQPTSDQTGSSPSPPSTAPALQ